MDIHENELRKIIQNILEILEKEGYLKDAQEKGAALVKPAYVLCEENHEQEFLAFLREQKSRRMDEKIAFTAILETPDDALIDAIVNEKLCRQIAGRDSVQQEDVVISIFPTFSHSSLGAAGLGINNTFASGWMKKDFETGRKSVVLISGIESFTGKEPACYRELIMSYIKNLMRMEVRFIGDGQDIAALLDEIT